MPIDCIYSLYSSRGERSDKYSIYTVPLARLHCSLLMLLSLYKMSHPTSSWAKYIQFTIRTNHNSHIYNHHVSGVLIFLHILYMYTHKHYRAVSQLFACASNLSSSRNILQCQQEDVPCFISTPVTPRCPPLHGLVDEHGGVHSERACVARRKRHV